MNGGSYKRLCEFVGDVMRILENCRYYNQPGNPLLKNAENLEIFFAQKLVALREKLSE